MDLNTILLVCAALVPAIALCIYIFIKDRAEKEPIGLLLTLFGLGAASCFPAVIGELIIGGILDACFASASMTDITLYVYQFLHNFVGIALVEECMKFLVLVLVTRKNKHFNSLFDGIVYAVFVSLGFAALENVLYVVENGWVNAVMRAIMSVPGHMFFGVMMGYYYSLWHVIDKAAELERRLAEGGVLPLNVPKFSSKRERVLCLLIPILFHGFYDFCCFVGGWFTLVLIGFVIFMYIYCFGKIRKVSKADCNDYVASSKELIKKYPFLQHATRNQ